MLVKFFKHGTQKTKSSDSVRSYLLDERAELGTAKVIRGNELITSGIIDSIQRFAKTYTSGCLSFDENETLTDEQKQRMIDDFENTLLPSLERNQFSSYWVEHNDKGRLELNFVIANVDLHSKKAMTIYNHFSDFNTVNLWKKLTNFQYGFNDPSDPANARNFVSSHVHAPRPSEKPSDKEKKKLKKDYASEIGTEIEQRIEQNQVKNRDDVLLIINELGYSVSDVQKQFIKIANPDPTLYRGKKRRDIKLTGDYFEENFTPSHTTSDFKQQQSQAFNDDLLINFDKYCDEYESRLENRGKFLLKNYGQQHIETPIPLFSTPQRPANYDELMNDYQKRHQPTPDPTPAPQPPTPPAPAPTPTPEIERKKPTFKPRKP